jgi:YVTN family beta-propeller protein
LFNSGAGVSGLWNVAVAQLIGAAALSGMSNYGSQTSGWANLGSAVAGWWNTSSVDPEVPGWLSGFGMVGSQLAGLFWDETAGRTTFNLGVGNVGVFNFGGGNVGDWNFGDGNQGSVNFGSGNVGGWNFGSGNLGGFNLGSGNEGSNNLGSGNAGSGNFGFGNLGSGNFGLGNAGDGNIGLGNTGNNNFGFGNTGNNNFGIGLTGDNQFGFGGLNSGTGNFGLFNSGSGNSGFFNAGTGNQGLFNSGSNSFGIGNAGSTSTGLFNVGDVNSGVGNVGDLNTGWHNVGSYNSGDANVGDVNTGSNNVGDRNTGWLNNGDANTGLANTGNLNTGAFISGSANNGLFQRGDDGGQLHLEVAANLSELPFALNADIPLNIPVTASLGPDPVRLAGFTVAEIPGELALPVLSLTVGVTTSGINAILGPIELPQSPSIGIGPITVPDINIVATEPLLSATLGGEGTSIPISLNGAIGPVKITLLDLSGPGLLNATTAPSSGLFNSGAGGGSGIFNSGAGVSGLWNLAVQQLLGAVVPGLSGWFNEGSGSGLANLGGLVSGRLNTSTQPPAQPGVISGLANTGTGTSGRWHDPLGLGDYVDRIRGRLDTPIPLMPSDIDVPTIPITVGADIGVNIPFNADLGTLSLQGFTIPGFPITTSDWTTDVNLGFPADLPYPGGGLSLDGCRDGSGNAQCTLLIDFAVIDGIIPVGALTVPTVSLDLPDFAGGIGGAGTSIPINFAAGIGPFRVTLPTAQQPDVITVSEIGIDFDLDIPVDVPIDVTMTSAEISQITINAVNIGPGPFMQAAIVTPFGTVLNPAIGRAYVANNGNGRLITIETTSKQTETTTVGSGPSGVAVSPDGTRTYVTNNGANTVSVIETGIIVAGEFEYVDPPAVVATIALGSGTKPLGVAVSPDGTRAYVTNNGTNSVSVINTATNVVTGTFGVGTAPSGIAFAPSGARVYVANNGANSVSVIETTGNTVIATVAVGTKPSGVVVTPDGTRVYVTNNTANTVSVIETTGNTVIATIAVGTNPTGVAVTPDGALVYVANNNASAKCTVTGCPQHPVSVISTATNTVVATISVGYKPDGMAVTPDGELLYVVNSGSGTFGACTATAERCQSVWVVDVDTNAVVQKVGAGLTTPFNTPTAIAINPETVTPYPSDNPCAGDDNYGVCAGLELVPGVTVGPFSLGPISIGNPFGGQALTLGIGGPGDAIQASGTAGFGPIRIVVSDGKIERIEEFDYNYDVGLDVDVPVTGTIGAVEVDPFNLEYALQAFLSEKLGYCVVAIAASLCSPNGPDPTDNTKTGPYLQSSSPGNGGTCGSNSPAADCHITYFVWGTNSDTLTPPLDRTYRGYPRGPFPPDNTVAIVTVPLIGVNASGENGPIAVLPETPINVPAPGVSEFSGSGTLGPFGA